MAMTIENFVARGERDTQGGSLVVVWVTINTREMHGGVWCDRVNSWELNLSPEAAADVAGKLLKAAEEAVVGVAHAHVD